MKARAIALLSMIALGMCAPGARADQAAEKEIRAVFDKASQLVDKKDTAGLVKITAPDAIFAFPEGTKLGVKDWADTTKKQFAEMGSIKSVIKVDILTVKGKQAVVMMMETDDYTMTQEKGHKFHEVSKGKVSLRKTDKGWLPYRFDFASDTILRDGKPFTPPTK